MEKAKKLLLLTIMFDVSFVVIATIIMHKNDTINLINTFDIKILSLFLAVLLAPSLITALILCKIKKDSEKQFILKQSILAIIFLLFCLFIMNFVLAPLG